MKKMISLVLAAVLVLSLAACGDKIVRTRSLPLSAVIFLRPTPARTLPASST